MKAFEITGIDIEFYNCRERDESEIFPWDFIDIRRDQGLPSQGVGTRDGRRSNAELPDAVFRLRGSKV